MLKVTSSAKCRLKNDLCKERGNLSEYARVVYSPSDPARIGFRIDYEREDDLIIPDNDGEKLLLLSPAMRNALSAFVLDYIEIPDVRKFTISRISCTA